MALPFEIDCFSHSNRVVVSNLSLRIDEMKGLDGSYSIDFKAWRCCVTISWRRCSSLPVSSFSGGASRINHLMNNSGAVVS